MPEESFTSGAPIQRRESTPPIAFSELVALAPQPRKVTVLLPAGWGWVCRRRSLPGGGHAVLVETAWSDEGIAATYLIVGRDTPAVRAALQAPEVP